MVTEMGRFIKNDRTQSSLGRCIEASKDPTRQDTTIQEMLQDQRKANILSHANLSHLTKKAMWLATKHYQKGYSAGPYLGNLVT